MLLYGYIFSFVMIQMLAFCISLFMDSYLNLKGAKRIKRPFFFISTEKNGAKGFTKDIAILPFCFQITNFFLVCLFIANAILDLTIREQRLITVPILCIWYFVYVAIAVTSTTMFIIEHYKRNKPKPNDPKQTITYILGNPLKVKYRDHFCYKCGTALHTVKHSKILDYTTELGKYYKFLVEADGSIADGLHEFVHEVFYCPNCGEDIEFVTQLNQEDIAIITKQVEKHYGKKGRKVLVKHYLENSDTLSDKSIGETTKLCVSIQEPGKKPILKKIPVSRKKRWERPFYFKISKNDIKKWIK